MKFISSSSMAAFVLASISVSASAETGFEFMGEYLERARDKLASLLGSGSDSHSDTASTVRHIKSFKNQNKSKSFK